MVSLVRVIHDHNDDAALRLLARGAPGAAARGRAAAGGTHVGNAGCRTVGDAYFGFYLLAMGRGKPRTPEALQDMLLAAGFVTPQLLRTRQPLQSRLMVARKG